MTTVVAHTPNGREIRLKANGRVEVQPRNDNYWIECRSIQEALYRYEHPHGEYVPNDRERAPVGTYRTQAAAAMIAAIDAVWDRDRYVMTRDAGYLAEPDEDELRSICEQTGEDFSAANDEVMGLIRAQCSLMGL